MWSRTLVVFLAGCGCDFVVDGVCVLDPSGRFSADVVRDAVRDVGEACRLRLGSPLVVEFTVSPPDNSEGGSPVPGVFTAATVTARVWASGEDPLETLRHELVHAGLCLSGYDTDGEHARPDLWCPLGCLGEVVECR